MTDAFFNRIAAGPSSGKESEDDFVPVTISLPVTPFADPAVAADIESIQMNDEDFARIAGPDAHKTVTKILENIEK